MDYASGRKTEQGLRPCVREGNTLYVTQARFARMKQIEVDDLRYGDPTQAAFAMLDAAGYNPERDGYIAPFTELRIVVDREMSNF